MERRTCESCTNKYLCPEYPSNMACMGWCDRKLFVGLLKMSFILMPEKYIDERMDSIAKFQADNKKRLERQK